MRRKLVLFVFLLFTINKLFLIDSVQSTENNINSGDSLEIHVIASQDDMNNNFFRIEYRESITSSITNRKLYFVWGDVVNKENCLIPYIDDTIGTFEKSERNITYSFIKNGPVSYGYFVHPTDGIFGSGFCNQDVGILDLYNYLPFGLENYHEVTIFFDVPEDMRVYAPWVKTSDSDRIYKIVGDDIIYPDTAYSYNLSLVAWGNFTSQDSLDYGSHKFYMLGYNNNTINIFRLMKFSYDYFMQAYNNNLQFLPTTNIVVMLPDYGGGQGGNNYGANRESPGGFYNPNIDGNEWEPNYEHFNEFGYVGGYLNVAYNMGWPSVNGVHCIAHSILNPTYQGCRADYWYSEGVAVFYQIDILYRIGILDEELVKREYIEHLKYYQEEIVAKGLDRKLYGAGREGWTDLIFWIAYKKGALIFYVFDKLIQNYTNKELSIIDFWANYFTEMRNNRNKYNDWNDCYEISVKILTEMTGKNFNEFFDRYIYKAGPLPLEIQDKDIAVNFNSPAVIYQNIPQKIFIPQNNSEITVNFEDKSSLSVKMVDGIVKHKYLNLNHIVNIENYLSDIKEFDNELYYLDISIDDTQCSAEISICYTDSLLLFYNIVADSLVFCRWDNSQWKVLDSIINKETNTITALTDQLSLFALVSSAANIRTLVENTPLEFHVSPPYPNPFNQYTIIKYSLPEDGIITLKIYNASGQTVQVLKNSFMIAGNYSFTWNAADMPSGLYFCTLKANGVSETRKMVLVK